MPYICLGTSYAHTSRTAAENVNNIITLFLHSSPARSRNNAWTAAAAVVTAAAVLEKNRGSPRETSVPQCCQRRSPSSGMDAVGFLSRWHDRVVSSVEMMIARARTGSVGRKVAAGTQNADGPGGGRRPRYKNIPSTIYRDSTRAGPVAWCIVVCSRVCAFVPATTKIGFYSFKKLVFLTVRARPIFFCFLHWFVSLGFVHTVREQFFLRDYFAITLECAYGCWARFGLIRKCVPMHS